MLIHILCVFYVHVMCILCAFYVLFYVRKYYPHLHLRVHHLVHASPGVRVCCLAPAFPAQTKLRGVATCDTSLSTTRAGATRPQASLRQGQSHLSAHARCGKSVLASTKNCWRPALLRSAMPTISVTDKASWIHSHDYCLIRLLTWWGACTRYVPTMCFYVHNMCIICTFYAPNCPSTGYTVVHTCNVFARLPTMPARSQNLARMGATFLRTR